MFQADQFLLDFRRENGRTIQPHISAGKPSRCEKGIIPIEHDAAKTQRVRDQTSWKDTSKTHIVSKSSSFFSFIVGRSPDGGDLGLPSGALETNILGSVLNSFECTRGGYQTKWKERDCK